MDKFNLTKVPVMFIYCFSSLERMQKEYREGIAKDDNQPGGTVC